MSFGVNSFGVDSFGAQFPESSGASGLTLNCGLAAADATGFAAQVVGGLTVSCALGSASASGLSASVLTLPAVDFKIAVIGDSNASGRCSSNQPAPASGAYLYDNSGAVVALADPWDGGTNTYAALDDAGSAAGSFVPRLAQHYADAGKTTLWVPANKGGTQTSNWSRSLLTTTCYGAMKARIDAVGGVDKIVICLGANDGIAAVSQATFVSRMNTLIADLTSDFPGASIYLQKIQDFSGYGSQIATIRAGVEEVWNGTSGVLRGANLEGITTSVHYATNAEAIAVGDRTYAALEGLNILASVGAAAATGYTASFPIGSVISADLGVASASGLVAQVVIGSNINAQVGIASAIGHDAVVNNAAGLVISCSLAIGDAIGYDAVAGSGFTVSATVGNASAAGYTAAIELASTIAAQMGSASGVGYLTIIGTSGGSIGGEITLSPATITALSDAIANAIWTHPLANNVSAADNAAAVLAILNATTIPVDVKKMNSAIVTGDGQESDPWRGVGVSP